MAKIIKIQNETRVHYFCQEIREVLKQGGAIGYPTDTFYALGVDPWNPAAVESIYSIKKRPFEKPILLLISSLRQLDNLILNVDQYAHVLMEALWPGPLTLLFEAKPDLPELLTAGSGKIGIRLPASPLAVKLIECLGHPLTGSSANLNKRPNCLSAQEVEESLGSELSLIVDGGSYLGGKPSTILDVSKSPPRLIREGASALSQIEGILEMKISSL